MQRRFDWVIALGALAGIGCSGPVPTAAAVGLSLHVGETVACGIGGSQPRDDIGNPEPDSTKNYMGKKIYNGEGGVEASCSVKGDGPWQIFASISSTPDRVTFLVNNGTIDGDGTGTADIALSTSGLLGSVSSGAPGERCSLKAVESNGGIFVKSGAVWATFTCNSLHSPPSRFCYVTGEFLLENCER
jgi:hypothetical protein